MSRVGSHNEWDPLEEVILGSAKDARIPVTKDRSLHAIFYSDYGADYLQSAPAGPYPERLLQEAEEDLDLFAEQLENLGVRVRRPDAAAHARTFSSPDWGADGHYSYCPRDSLLVVGDEILEPPMPLRHRYFENFAYRRLLREYFASGARWSAAPRPQLLDEAFELREEGPHGLSEVEPLFDAANLLRCGRDLFYLVSNTGNRAGARWLQSHLGPGYRLHPMEGLYSRIHVDTTLLPLRPGLVLANPERVNHENLPVPFRQWDVLYAPEPVVVPYLPHWLPATTWISMNVLSLSPSLVAVEERQRPLIALLERRGFDVVPVRLRHCRTLSGGPHCVTLDVRRRGELEDYFT
jgi:N-dimethylarginine dimethylaminohydrolase